MEVKLLLAIDIGNTSTSLGLFEEDELLSEWRIETKKDMTVGTLVQVFSELFEPLSVKTRDVEGISISNVVPGVSKIYEDLSKTYFNCDPFFVDSANAGINIKYPNPSEIGADRLVNAVAAVAKYAAPIIVVDFGTATTFDFVDEEGAYCGGSIAPGIMIATEALFEKTSKLPRVDIEKTQNVISKSTVDAIKSGVYHGYQGLVKFIVDKMMAEARVKPKVIATGGLALLIVTDIGIEVDRLLTLNGLRIIWSKNQNLKLRT